MHERYMQQAIDLAEQAIEQETGGPFGAIIVDVSGKVIGQGQNRVLQHMDPTAHAEVVAIRDACRHSQTYDLSSSVIYTSCEPCPMCLGAIYWARLAKIYYAATRTDAADIGFDDHLFYQEFDKDNSKRGVRMVELRRDSALKIFAKWKALDQKRFY